jgi:hypothetical protein
MLLLFMPLTIFFGGVQRIAVSGTSVRVNGE